MFELKQNKKIFIITNRNLIKQGNIYEVVEKCAARGADGVILREKDLDYNSLKKMAQEIKSITEKYNIPLIINGNFDVAKEVNAYGYHTGVEGLRKLTSGNQLLSENMERGLESTCETLRIGEHDSKKLMLGVSVHSAEEAVEAEKLGADYLIAGNVFETDCKPGLKGRGIDFIEKVCKSVNIPVIAIGGITQNNLNELLNTKVFGVAVMSYGMRI